LLVSGQVALPEPLEPAERDRLAELEGAVDRGRRPFLEVGNALAEIRDGRLYREAHPTFDGYLRERWGMGRSRGYQLIDAAQVAGVVSTVVDTGDWREQLLAENGVAPAGPDRHAAPDAHAGAAAAYAASTGARPSAPPPANERVARKLSATAKTDPDRAREIWRRTVEQHGPDATAEQVAAVAAELQPAVSGEVVGPPDIAEARRRYSSAASSAFRSNDAAAARQALAVWRQEIRPALERIARDGVEVDRSRWRR
jgi:hypothetical protein